MPFRESAGIRYFQFESLALPALQHAILTRRGGVSPRPWASLNLGGTVGDDPDRVGANLQRAMEATGLRSGSLFQVWQVHSAEVARADGPQPDRSSIKADAIVTNRTGVTLLMRFADCVPILIFDPVRSAIGMAHAGWLGTVRGVATALVRNMTREFGSEPGDLLAALGPSIGPDHYPVGPEVAAQVESSFGPAAPEHLRKQNGSLIFDLWSANRWQLESGGIRSVEVSGICTACHLNDWYSHRGEHGQTGRFGAVIALSF